MSCTKHNAKIRGGDCNIPRPSPDCNYEYNMFCRLVRKIFISWSAYVLIMPKSLDVKGQEPILYM
jgi:hypothetical protein